jgi:hypothetical protein
MSFENQSNPMECKPDEGLLTLTTVTQKQIVLKNPALSEFDIYDIANGLSLLCRFGGQIERFYSVAQHSILVAALAPKELKREALLHDASEAFLGDVIKPLKALLGLTYKQIERQFEEVIFSQFGLEIDKLAAVKEFDLQAYFLEDRALRKNKPEMLEAAMQDADMILASGKTVSSIYYQPITAKMEFLRMFGILFNDRSKMGG